MSLFNVYPLYQMTPSHAKMCYVYEKNGTKYLDLYGGHAVISIGHSHPKYVKALTNQLNKRIKRFFWYRWGLGRDHYQKLNEWILVMFRLTPRFPCLEGLSYI